MPPVRTKAILENAGAVSLGNSIEVHQKAQSARREFTRMPY